MTIKEAIIFELTHNFIVNSDERAAVLTLAALELDMGDHAIGAYINFNEYVDGLLDTIKETI